MKLVLSYAFVSFRPIQNVHGWFPTHLGILSTCFGEGLGSSAYSSVVEHLPSFMRLWAPSLVPPQNKQNLFSQDFWKTVYHDSQEKEWLRGQRDD